MQTPVVSNYPRARLGGVQDDQEYAVLQLRAYVLLNTLIAAQVAWIICSVLTVVAMTSLGARGMGPNTLAFALGFWLVCAMLCGRLGRLFRQSVGWSRGYAAKRLWTILFTTPIGLGIFLAWKIRREVETELLQFGVERGMFGWAIDVAKAEEHFFNLRLKRAVPEGLDDRGE